MHLGLLTWRERWGRGDPHVKRLPQVEHRSFPGFLLRLAPRHLLVSAVDVEIHGDLVRELALLAPPKDADFEVRMLPLGVGIEQMVEAVGQAAEILFDRLEGLIIGQVAVRVAIYVQRVVVAHDPDYSSHHSSTRCFFPARMATPSSKPSSAKVRT